MYHVLGTGLIATLLYLISYFLYRSRIFTLQFHRKLWNTGLAATFILTALAGILLALQINYKWEIQFISTILRWHVEIGLGLAFTGLFHLSWHLSYNVGVRWAASESPISTPDGKYSRQRRVTVAAVSSSQNSSSGKPGLIRASISTGAV